LAVDSQDCGPSPKFLAEQFETGLRGYSSGGRLNTKHRWDPDNIIDAADRLEMTIFSGKVAYAGRDTCEVAVRNTQAFKPAPGERIAWSLEDAGQKTISHGEVVVDESGVIVLPAILFGSPARLVLERATN
jgi:hypothetical protein